MIKQSLRSAVRAVAPHYALDTYLHLKRMRHARRLISLRDRSSDPSVWIDELLRSYFFRPLQKRSEILRLTEIVRALRPATVCEIGAAGGGTAFMFAHAAAPDAVIVSIDSEFTASRRAAVSRFALPGQRLVCLQADSQCEETLHDAASYFGERCLDFLFIDGDHSYPGVSTDFELYSSLVRPGGVIAFHDIVPVAEGDKHHDAGSVPEFWREVKAHYPSTDEIIDDASQSGCGVGVLYLT